MQPLVTLIIYLIALFLITLPVRMAADAMGAKRNGFLWSLLAIFGASLMYGFGLSFPVFGTLAAFLLSSAAFAFILGTDFLRGMGIHLLSVLFGLLIGFLVNALFGINLPELVPTLNGLQTLLPLTLN